jgi:predicted GNAT superfamily acetyltransferase
MLRIRPRWNLEQAKVGINHNAAVNLVWSEISGFGQVLKQSFQLADAGGTSLGLILPS